MSQIELRGQVEDADVLDLLAGLVNKSLVAYEEDEHGLGRYRLLETVRQYGRDRLADSEEAEEVHRQHQQFFAALADLAVAEMIGPKQAEWLECLETEHDNLRSALEWCLTQHRAEAGLRLAGTLGNFWLVRGYLSEGRKWLDWALSEVDKLEGADKPTESNVWTKALTLSGGLASAQGDVSAAEAVFERAATLAREAGDYLTLAWALRGLGWCRMCPLEEDKAPGRADSRALFEESLSLFRQVEDQHGVTFSLRNLGDLAFAQGEYEVAHTYFAESLRVSRRLGDTHGVSGSLMSLSRVAYMQDNLSMAWILDEEALLLSRQIGDQGAVVVILSSLGRVASAQNKLTEAHAFFQEALPLSRRLGLEASTASLHNLLGQVAARQGQEEDAQALYTQSMQIRWRREDLPYLAEEMRCFAGLAHSRHQFARAARLLGAAEKLGLAAALRMSPCEQREHALRVAETQEALGPDAWTAAFAAGQAMTGGQAVEYALAGGD